MFMHKMSFCLALFGLAILGNSSDQGSSFDLRRFQTKRTGQLQQLFQECQNKSILSRIKSASEDKQRHVAARENLAAIVHSLEIKDEQAFAALVIQFDNHYSRLVFDPEGNLFDI